MVDISLNKATTKKSSTKWFYVALVLTLALVGWTAFHGDSEQNDLIDDNTSQDSSNRHRNTHLNQLNKEHQIMDNADDSSHNMPIALKTLKGHTSSQKIRDVFEVHSWIPVVAPKKAEPVVPPPPEAPPVPFIYVGKLEDSPKGTQIFLMANNKLYSVLLGNNIDQEWRLDSEDVNTLTLTYLPLNLTQSLLKATKQPEAVVNAEANQ